MNYFRKTSALLGLAGLAACSEAPRVEPQYVPQPAVEQPQVPDSVRIRESVLSEAAERTGIGGEWTVKKIELDGTKVPLCNCRSGDYLIAVAPGDTARAFFSTRGEYLSSIATVAADANTRTRRLSSDKDTVDHVQKKVKGRWMFDHTRRTIGDTVFQQYYGADNRFEELGRPLFSVSPNGSLTAVERYNGIHGGDGSHDLSHQGEYRVGQFFELFTDARVDGKLVERRGTYFNQPKNMKPYSEVAEGATYLPSVQKFLVRTAETHQVAPGIRIVQEKQE